MPGVEQRETIKSRYLDTSRFLFSQLIGDFIPYTLNDKSGGLRECERLLIDRYGVLLFISHPTILDGGLLTRFIGDNPVMATKEVVFPMAYHQYHDPITGPPARLVGKLLDYQLKPVVTTDTLAKPRFRNVNPRKGLIQYLNIASQVLLRGGIVVVNPQTGRRSTLGEPEGPAMSVLIRSLMKEHERVGKGNQDLKVALMPIGIGIPGIADYSKVKGFRSLGSTFEIVTGNPTLLSDLLQLGVDRKAQEIVLEKWAYDQLKQVVPPAYLDPTGKN